MSEEDLKPIEANHSSKLQAIYSLDDEDLIIDDSDENQDLDLQMNDDDEEESEEERKPKRKLQKNSAKDKAKKLKEAQT